jgi:hypothetical protein
LARYVMILDEVDVTDMVKDEGLLPQLEPTHEDVQAALAEFNRQLIAQFRRERPEG